MRAFVIKEFGQPGEVTEVPDPQPADGEVLVRLKAASVNPMDAFVVSGGTQEFAETHLPLVPGLDGAGVVEAVAPGGNGFHPGDEVVISGNKPYWGEGTFAEMVAVPTASVAHKPDTINYEVASTVPLTGLTALGVADQIEAGPDKVIAVLGATGGVGGWFTQIAAQRGATIIALTRPENADYARSLGAADVADYADPAQLDQLGARYPQGIDSIADFSGNADVIKSLARFTRDGALLVSTATRVDPAEWTGHGLIAAQGQKADVGRLSELVEMLARGELVAPEYRVVNLESTGDAIAEVGRGHTRGKVVVAID